MTPTRPDPQHPIWKTEYVLVWGVTATYEVYCLSCLVLPQAGGEAVETGSNGGRTDLTNLQATAYAGLAFCVAAVLPPSVYAAAFRLAIAAMFAHHGTALRAEIDSASAVEDVLAVQELPPVTHWKGRLDVNLVIDDGAYPFQVTNPATVYWCLLWFQIDGTLCRVRARGPGTCGIYITLCVLTTGLRTRVGSFRRRCMWLGILNASSLSTNTTACIL